jgi:hypothetical protein
VIDNDRFIKALSKKVNEKADDRKPPIATTSIATDLNAGQRPGVLWYGFRPSQKGNLFKIRRARKGPCKLAEIGF